jgi:hypothetical protein
MLHDLRQRDRRIVDQRHAAIDDFGEIVRRDVGRHADGDAARAVDQQVREPRRQDGRFMFGAVIIVLEIDSFLVDVFQQFVRDLFQTRFRVAHRRGRIAVDGAEIALSVDQRHAQRPVLRHAHHGVIDRGVAMRVIFTHDVADDAGRFHVFAVPVETAFMHGIEDAAVHGFQPVAHVRKRPAHDHAHRVIEIGPLHFLENGDRFDAVVTARTVNRCFVAQ